MSEQITIRFDEEIKARLTELSHVSQRPVAQIIRQCIIDHLEDLEDIYVSTRVLEKNERTWSMQDLRARYKEEL